MGTTNFTTLLSGATPLESELVLDSLKGKVFPEIAIIATAVSTELPVPPDLANPPSLSCSVFRQATAEFASSPYAMSAIDEREVVYAFEKHPFAFCPARR